ncbi:MAG: BatA domain-containing protein, partial [Alphaproteobacteria bacterium]
MLSIGVLSFAVPWLLLALAALPVLWWLLRAVPPAPVRVAFPAIRLLFGLPQHEETPHRTPWWLLAMRLLLAALVILALAHPIIDPGRILRGNGPLVMVIDNGWTGGANWTERQDTAAALIDEAARENRTVYIATTAKSVERTDAALRPLSPAEARDRIRSIAPQPWAADYARVRAQIEALELSRPATAIWLSSGLDAPDGARDTRRADARAKPLELALQRLGSLRYIHPAPGDQPLIISATESAPDGIRVRVSRMDAGGTRSAALIANDDDGRLLGRAAFTFDAGVEAAD